MWKARGTRLIGSVQRRVEGHGIKGAMWWAEPTAECVCWDEQPYPAACASALLAQPAA